MSRAPGLNGTAAAVLAYLDGGPQSGWDIANGLRDLVGDFWNVTPSQVYRELRTMAEAGLVKAGPAGARDRRPYTITKRGRDAIATWFDAPLDPDVVRIPLLLRLFLIFASSDPDNARLPGLLDQYRSAHAAQLRGYEAKLDELTATGLPQAHLVRYGVFHERAILAWLDSLPWTP